MVPMAAGTRGGVGRVGNKRAYAKEVTQAIFSFSERVVVIMSGRHSLWKHSAKVRHVSNRLHALVLTRAIFTARRRDYEFPN